MILRGCSKLNVFILGLRDRVHEYNYPWAFFVKGFQRRKVTGVHLGAATGARLSQQLSQPQQHGEVSGSKLIRRPHGFGPLRLGQPRSALPALTGYGERIPTPYLCALRGFA